MDAIVITEVGCAVAGAKIIDSLYFKEGIFVQISECQATNATKSIDKYLKWGHIE